MAERTDLDETTKEWETDLSYESGEEKDETERIQEQIEETRQEMSETIDALQEKLSLENISEQVSEQVSKQLSNVYQKTKESVFDFTMGNAKKIMDTVNKEMQNSKIYHVAKENPLPILLIALGTGLLIFNRKNRNGSNYRQISDGRQEEPGMFQKTRKTLSETASSTYRNTSEMAGEAYQTVSDAVGKTVDKAYDLSGQVQEQYDHFIQEKPLALGAVALAAGVSVGLMIPTTQYEEELMGNTSRNLLTKARDKTEETVKSLKNAAGEAFEVFKDEVETQIKE